MKTIEFVIDLTDAKNEQDVFDKLNSVFREELKNYTWDIRSWDGLDDFLWGFIQGALPNDPVSYGSDVEKLEIKIINSKHLDKWRALLVKNAEKSIYEALSDSFNFTMEERAKRLEPDDPPVFKNSTLEIIS